MNKHADKFVIGELYNVFAETFNSDVIFILIKSV